MLFKTPLNLPDIAQVPSTSSDSRALIVKHQEASSVLPSIAVASGITTVVAVRVVTSIVVAIEPSCSAASLDQPSWAITSWAITSWAITSSAAASSLAATPLASPG